MGSPQEKEPTDDAREQALFAAAVEQAPGWRAVFIAGACLGNPALRSRLEALLEAHERPATSLDEQTEAARTTLKLDSADDAAGQTLGRYKLLERIGEGGCGVVYVAEQNEPVRRRVALKIIKLGMDTKQVVARFEAERQALAMMDHPNIAKVLDAGATETGRPFFVMELVRGIKITDYCDQAGLTTKERLDLFIKVCQAIQHAHQKGIIHRDIKPSNILVTLHDGVPVPKVIDFGIAKATEGRLTDATVYTQLHQFIGTPAYMSPEQAEMSGLDIDTRSDIYSLGVLLYELLVGSTPFDPKELMAAGVDAMRKTIREKEPPRPSTRFATLGADQLTTTAKRRSSDTSKLMHQLQGDLDWIVMKCLEKDRQRRYETANGLAADLKRHLKDEPVAARPPSTAYRFERALRRNKLAFAAGAAITAILIIGLTVSLRLYYRESQAYRRAAAAEREQSRMRADAEQARAKEARLREQAQTNEKRASAEAVKSEQVATFLKDMLKAAGPSVALGRDTTLLREILDKTAERVGQDLKDQPEVQGDLYVTLAQTYYDLSAFPKAESMLVLALDHFRGTLTNPHPKIAFALGRLGVIQTGLDNKTDGKPKAEAALQMARQLNDPKTLIACLINMAGSFAGFNVVSESVPLVREAIAVQKQIGDDPVAIANNLSYLGICLVDSDAAAAEAYIREALAIHRKFLGSNHLSVARDLDYLGQNMVNLGRLEEAENLTREAVQLLRPMLAIDHRQLVFRIKFLSGILLARGKWGESEALLKDCVARSPDNAEYLSYLGGFYARRGNWVEAIAYLRRADAADPHGDFFAEQLAVALLQAGQTNEYVELSRRQLAKNKDTREAGIADKTAKMALLLATDSADVERAGRLADQVGSVNEPSYVVPWFQLCKALAELRRNHFDSAVDWSSRSLGQTAAPLQCRAAAQFVQSIARKRRGLPEAAGAALAAGKALMATAKDFKKDDFGGEWQDWLIADHLRREAEAP